MSLCVSDAYEDEGRQVRKAGDFVPKPKPSKDEQLLWTLGWRAMNDGNVPYDRRHADGGIGSRRRSTSESWRDYVWCVAGPIN